jgi:hypothetical protein
VLNPAMEIVRKSLDFIDDKDLQILLEERLGELERVFTVNANLSTIILSISCIEGIFKHIATIFKDLIKSSPDYPLKNDSKKRTSVILRSKNYTSSYWKETFFIRLRILTKYIPSSETIATLSTPEPKRNLVVGLGQAQMALGLLNATIDQMSNYIFIGSEILTSIPGRPRFDLSKVLHLDLSNTRTHSFTLLKRRIKSDL